jgi:hypothetical protein
MRFRRKSEMRAFDEALRSVIPEIQEEELQQQSEYVHWRVRDDVLEFTDLYWLNSFARQGKQEEATKALTSALVKEHTESKAKVAQAVNSMLTTTAEPVRAFDEVHLTDKWFSLFDTVDRTPQYLLGLRIINTQDKSHLKSAGDFGWFANLSIENT